MHRRRNENSNPLIATVGDCFPCHCQVVSTVAISLGKMRLLRFTRNDIYYHWILEKQSDSKRLIGGEDES